MRKIFFFILLLASFISKAQILQKVNTYGYEYNRVAIDSLSGQPTDTLIVPVRYQHIPFIAVKNDVHYTWSPFLLRWMRTVSVSTGDRPDALRYGGSVTYSGTGLVFNVSETGVTLCDFDYDIDSIQITLPPGDPDFNKFYTIYADSTGIHVLEGEAAAPALIPKVEGCQWPLAEILVEAGETTPSLSTQIIYDENTESIVTSVLGTSDGNNTTNVFRPVKSTNVSNIQNNGYVLFQTNGITPVTWDLTNVDALALHIKLKIALPNNATIRVMLVTGNTNAGTIEPIIALNRTSTEYQAISIPKDAFGTIQNNFITGVRFRYVRPGNPTVYSGFYLDYIYLQEGIVITNPNAGVQSVGIAVNGNALIESGTPVTTTGFFNLDWSGNAEQYVDGLGNLRTFPAIPFVIGDIDGRSKTDEGGVIDGDSLFLQLADATYPGLLSPALWAKISPNDSITNLGIYDSLLVYVSDTLLGIKTLKDSTGIGIVDRGSYLAFYLTGSGSTPNLQEVTDEGNTTTQSMTSTSTITALTSFVKPSYTSAPVLSSAFVGNGTSAYGAINFREFSTGGGQEVVLSPVLALTANRELLLPDENDTLATRTYARSVATTPTLQAVTDVGNETTNNIYSLNNNAQIASSNGLKVAAIVLSNSDSSGSLQLTNTNSGTGFISAHTQPSTTISQFELPVPSGQSIDTLATLADVRDGGGGGSNLSYDAANHEVDIDGGGTSAVIPLSLADGATEGLASFTAADFDATAGNISIDYTNGQASSGSTKGFLSSADWTTFNGKQSALTNSAGLAAALTDEDGSGLVQFQTTANPAHTTITPSGTGISPSTMPGVLDADFGLTDATGVQTAFPTGIDVWTLQGSTTYHFWGQYNILGGTASKTIGMAFALSGGLTLNAISYSAGAWNGLANTLATSTTRCYTNQVSVQVLTVAATTAGNHIVFEGYIRTNVGGQITPQISFGTNAPAGAVNMKAGSFIHFEPVGNNTFTTLGNPG